MQRLASHHYTDCSDVCKVPDNRVQDELMAFCISCEPNRTLRYHGTHRAPYDFFCLFTRYLFCTRSICRLNRFVVRATAVAVNFAQKKKKKRTW